MKTQQGLRKPSPHYPRLPIRTTQWVINPSQDSSKKKNPLRSWAPWRGTKRKIPTDKTLGSIPTSPELRDTIYSHLWSTYYVLGTLPKTLYMLIHLIFTIL